MKKHIAKNKKIVATTYPNVFITINKNRLKCYRGNEIFLKDGDEFELELDNTTKQIWLTKIKLNGKWVSEAGIVLRPGEHFYLDTPDLDSSNRRKFRFDVYEIEKERSDLVEDNGLVEVFFYEECTFLPHWDVSITYPSYDEYRDPPYPYRPHWTYVTSPMTTGGMSNKLNEIGDGSGVQCYISNHSDSVNNFNSVTVNNANMEETGRIERGKKSKQDFVNVNKDFSTWYSHSVTYHILPLSKKPKTIQDIKQYCSSCGRRRRKKENFCSNCGQKV